MSGKQHKREAKRQKELQRQAAMAAERRRSLLTGAIVGAIVLIGSALIILSVTSERSVELASEAATGPTGPTGPTGTATPTAPPVTEVAANDPTVTPGSAVASSEPPTVDTSLPVACDGEEPEDATRARDTFPGGPAQVLGEGVDYRAVIETTCGTVVLDLREDAAPVTVNSFVFLAQAGFFDALEIFRNAASIGALQTGSGTNTASWQIGYRLPDELTLAQTEGYPAGSVAMANAGPNSAGSQFFFVYNDSFDLAFQGPARTYARFADVVEGLDVLETIGAITAGGETGEAPQERVYMETVTITDAEGNPVAAATAGPTAGATASATPSASASASATPAATATPTEGSS